MIVTELCFYIAMFIYSMIYDLRFIVIYSVLIFGYLVVHWLIPRGKYNSLRRMIQIGSFSNPREGNCYYHYQIDYSIIRKYLEKINKEQDTKITLTHVVLKAIAEMNKNCPQINGRIWMGKFIPYQTVNVGCLCDVGGGKDLAMINIENADQLGIKQIAQYINFRAKSIKDKKDKEHNKQVGNMKLMPPFMITISFDLINFIVTGMGLSLPFLGIKKSNLHGSSLVTNIGMMGHKDTYASHNIFSKVNCVVAINAIKKEPVVENDQIVIKEVVNLNFTTDHRFIDGGGTPVIIRSLDSVFHNPQNYT